MSEIYESVGDPPGSDHSLATIEETLLDDYVNVTFCLLLTSVPTQWSEIMRALRITIPTLLLAVIMVGCIVQADTYNDQNPFSAPDTLRSGDDGAEEGSQSNSTLPDGDEESERTGVNESAVSTPTVTSIETPAFTSKDVPTFTSGGTPTETPEPPADTQ